MGMKQRRNRSEMEALLVQREHEGLSFRVLSERSGVPIGTLSSWARKLGRVRQRAAPAFVRVAVADLEDASLRVQVNEYVSVLVPKGFDPSHLRDVVSALHSEC